MFSLGEKKETNNPATLLAGEHGTFRVVSPSGDVARYECQPGHSIASIEFLGSAEPRSQFLVEKIGDYSGESQLTWTPRKKSATAN